MGILSSSAAGMRNVISGNGLSPGDGDGVFIQPIGNSAVEGNWIGVAFDGVTPLGNTGSAVFVGFGSIGCETSSV